MYEVHFQPALIEITLMYKFAFVDTYLVFNHRPMTISHWPVHYRSHISRHKRRFCVCGYRYCRILCKRTSLRCNEVAKYKQYNYLPGRSHSQPQALIIWLRQMSTSTRGILIRDNGRRGDNSTLSYMASRVIRIPVSIISIY